MRDFQNTLEKPESLETEKNPKTVKWAAVIHQAQLKTKMHNWHTDISTWSPLSVVI